MNRVILALFVIGFPAAGASADLSPGARAAIDRYKAAIKAAESDGSPRSIEPAFAAFGALRDALTRLEGGETVLESLSKDEFARLERELPGALINREEMLFVEPDPDYFVRLAAKNGDAADRAFFGALKATYPDGIWAAYVEQQTDYSGCTRFGSMSLVDTYRVWTDFQRNFPGPYAAAAKKEVSDVLDQLTQSTCACGDMTAVERELQNFVKMFPQSPARAEVERRLDAVRTGASSMRVKCVSG